MAEQSTIRRARADARAGKAPSTQAGEFVREEFDHIRAGKHGARSPAQAIAIGLSKARRAGVKLPAPAPGKSSPQVRRQAERDLQKGQNGGRRSPKRARASLRALRHEGRAAATTPAIARQARAGAGRRSSAQRTAAARRAVRTKSPAGLAAAGRKAARTRAARL